jgi:hypothetical protein
MPSLLLPEREGPVDPSTITSILAPSSSLDKDRRSVLNFTDKRQRVTWNTSLNRVDRNNPKVRERHLQSHRNLLRGDKTESRGDKTESLGFFCDSLGGTR